MEEDPTIVINKIKMKYERFPDGEIFMQSLSNLRGVDAFVIQTLYPDPNEALMSLLLTVDAVKRASAERVTVVIPYMAYARQDRKEDGRVPISSKLIAKMIEASGCDRVLTMELHSGQTQGFYDIPCDNLTSFPIFDQCYVQDYWGQDELVFVSPDDGGWKRASKWAERFSTSAAIINKIRKGSQKVEMTELVGDVDGRHAVIVDDMTSTAGTIIGAAERCREAGAKRVTGIITHSLITKETETRVADSTLDALFVSDTTMHPTYIVGRNAKIRVCSAAKLFSDAIRSIHENTSVSILLR